MQDCVLVRRKNDYGVVMIELCAELPTYLECHENQCAEGGEAKSGIVHVSTQKEVDVKAAREKKKENGERGGALGENCSPVACNDVAVTGRRWWVLQIEDKGRPIKVTALPTEFSPYPESNPRPVVKGGAAPSTAPQPMLVRNPRVGYLLQQITYLVQQISDPFLFFPTVYSSVATGRSYITTDKIPGATDCKAKHDGVINAINTLTASVAEMTSKRGVIPSKRISYPDTPLKIKAAKRRRKDTSKASSIIKKGKIPTPLPLSCTDVQCARATEEQHELKKLLSKIVDNPLIASKDKEKVEPISFRERKNYPFEGFNISDEALKKLIQLINDYLEWITDRLLKHHVGRYCQQQPEVFRNEECLINIIKGFSIPASLPWHLVNEVYIPINYGDEFHWVLAVVVLKERRIRVYDSMDCGPFVTAYAEYLSDGLQVPNDGLDAGLLRKRYAALLWKYGEAKTQKPYATDVKDPRRPKPNFIALDEEQLVHIDYIFIARVRQCNNLSALV
ncbi:hypothetical protein BC332_18839 [Capsicum chinense]|nr:hypothetical protein BC332_18839 [Capsicum chinense]